MELGAAWAEILQKDEFTKSGYNLLSDYRNADFDFSINETDVIWNFLESIKHILNGKRESVITDKPFTTAISMLFEKQLYSKMGFNIKIFSTEQAALNWVTSKKCICFINFIGLLFSAYGFFEETKNRI
jgi:hypothetical protein